MTKQSMATKQKRKKKRKVEKVENESAAVLAFARGQAIEVMNKDLREQFGAIEATFDNMQTQNIRYYHELGQLIVTIREAPAKYVGNDGTPGVKLIEKALATQARTMRACAQFATYYSADEMAELAGLTHRETKWRLHWGHIKILLTVPSKDERAKYAHNAVARMMNPDLLHKHVQKEEGREEGHGRTHGVPSSVEGQFRQMLDISKKWHDKQQKVWRGDKINIFNNLMEATPNQITPELLDHDAFGQYLRSRREDAGNIPG